MKPVITVMALMALFYSHLSYAQNDTPMEVLVNIANEDTRFIPTPVLTQDDRNTDYLDAYLEDYTALKLNKEVLEYILKDAPEAIAIELPSPNGELLSVRLINHDVRSENFQIIDLTNNNTIPNPDAQFYRGVVDRKQDASAGLSFFNNKIYGVLTSTNMGNVALIPDPYDSADGENYILYAQEDVKNKTEVKCDADIAGKIGDYLPSSSRSNVYSTCEDIEIYIEATYKLYQQKGSSTETSNYITAFFNNSAILFRNEGIYTSLKELGINTSEDGYSSLDTPYKNLNAFGEATKNTHKQKGAELAHLVDYDSGGISGMAWINSMCNNYTYYSSVDYHFGGYAYSRVLTDTPELQDYSNSVFVFTHEMGHQLGSQHTQWCYWEGGPIDNCASVENGPCDEGPAPPSTGGTIMSYCHTKPQGINFSAGFGEQPGNLIRERIASKTCQAEYTPKNTVAAAASQTVTANRECTDEGGWTNYYFDNNTSDEGDDELLLSVLKGNEDIGNLDDGTLLVQLKTSSNAGSGSTAITNPGYTVGADWHVMNRWFELIPTEEPQNPVTVRFPYTSDDLVDVMLNQPMVSSHQDLIFYKVSSPGDPDPDHGHEDVSNDDINFYMNDDASSLTTWKYVKSGSKHFAEFQVSSFSGGGGGFTENAQPALPVNLVSYRADMEEKHVQLVWETASEINNDYFTLERSSDGIHFTRIAKKEGAGTVSATKFYDFKDRTPAAGLNYYRLSQTDFDGTHVHLGVRVVEYTYSREIKLFPNPLSASTLSLSYESGHDEELKIVVRNIEGRITHSLTKEVSEGSNLLSLSLPDMKSGIFMVQIQGKTDLYTTKLIKD